MTNMRHCVNTYTLIIALFIAGCKPYLDKEFGCYNYESISGKEAARLLGSFPCDLSEATTASAFSEKTIDSFETCLFVTFPNNSNAKYDEVVKALGGYGLQAADVTLNVEQHFLPSKVWKDVVDFAPPEWVKKIEWSDIGAVKYSCLEKRGKKRIECALIMADTDRRVLVYWWNRQVSDENQACWNDQNRSKKHTIDRSEVISGPF